jgi:UTP--glucose-1-phosphate uridylyltransferase
MLTFIEQPVAGGYGDAIFRAREFTGDEAFLHLVSDHLYLHHGPQRCAQQLVEIARARECSVSAVQATRESMLPYYGAVGGRRVPQAPHLYEVETVLEKPTPTEAEQKLIVPGLREGHYLCFFGMHVLTASVMQILEDLMHRPGGAAYDAKAVAGAPVADLGRAPSATAASPSMTPSSAPIPSAQSASAPSTISPRPAPPPPVQLSSALNLLAHQERYLAAELRGRRQNIGVKYGLLMAQAALALDGRDREDVMAQLIDLLASRQAARHADATDEPGAAGAWAPEPAPADSTRVDSTQADSTRADPAAAQRAPAQRTPANRDPTAS